MGKQVYLSKKEADWIIHWIDFESNPADDDEEKTLMKLRDKASAVLNFGEEEQS